MVRSEQTGILPVRGLVTPLVRPNSIGPIPMMLLSHLRVGEQRNKTTPSVNTLAVHKTVTTPRSSEQSDGRFTFEPRFILGEQDEAVWIDDYFSTFGMHRRDK